MKKPFDYQGGEDPQVENPDLEVTFVYLLLGITFYFFFKHSMLLHFHFYVQKHSGNACWSGSFYKAADHTHLSINIP